MNDETDRNILNIAGNIVSAYVSNNQLASADVPNLIRSVMAALDEKNGKEEPAVEEQKPAVSIKGSVRKDSIACLECGTSQKTLKRHLRVGHDLTPDEYRQKWGLPRDYPMVSATYSAARSAMAKKAGLGRGGRQAKKK